MGFIIALIPAIVALVLAFPAFTDAMNSAKWPTAPAVVVKNDLQVGRTAVFQVHGKKYSTNFEHALELTFSRFGAEFNLGNQVTKIDNVDAEIGKNITVSYNPANPNEAVVEPGFCIPVWIYLICTGLITFIRLIFPASHRN